MFSRLTSHIIRQRSLYPRLIFRRHEGTEVTRTSRDEGPPGVEEDEVVLSKVISPPIVPEVPLKSLDFVKSVKKAKKKGSFAVDFFVGRYDTDYLIYPDLLQYNDQLTQLMDQVNMVKQLYPQIWDDEHQLQKYNFYNIFQMSISEMMLVFEAIGASARSCYDSQKLATSVEQSFVLPQQTKVSKAILSLIIRNCLTYWPLSKSKNPQMRNFLPTSNIIYGRVEDEKLLPPIGFAWSEHAEGLGNLPAQEWQTTGLKGGEDAGGSYILEGKKSRVLSEEATDYYMVYFRDKFLSDRYVVDQNHPEPNPASDPFIGCAMLDKTQVNLSDVYLDSAGFDYVDLEINDVIAESQIVFPAERRDPHGLNIKALGQTAASAVVLGILKDSLRLVYRHLIKNKSGLLECEIIQKKLAHITSRIFAIESMVYFVSGMFDGLEDGFDAHLEAAMLKVVTNEYGYECLRDLQHVFGSDMLILSKLQDQLNTFDSFLDGNIFNRIYISSMGLLWYARVENKHLNEMRLPSYNTGKFYKALFQERFQRGDLYTLDADIYGNVHPSLKDAATILEFMMKRVKFAAEEICRVRGLDAMKSQVELYEMSKLVTDTFVLSAMMARASKSYSIGTRHGQTDVELCTSFARLMHDQFTVNTHQFECLKTSPFVASVNWIHNINLKSGGYYAIHPMDPNI